MQAQFNRISLRSSHFVPHPCSFGLDALLTGSFLPSLAQDLHLRFLLHDLHESCIVVVIRTDASFFRFDHPVVVQESSLIVGVVYLHWVERSVVGTGARVGVRIRRLLNWSLFNWSLFRDDCLDKSFDQESISFCRCIPHQWPVSRRPGA